MSLGSSPRALNSLTPIWRNPGSVLTAVVLALSAISACGPAPTPGEGSTQTARRAASPVLTMAVRNEPITVAARQFGQAGGTLNGLQAVFNAQIASNDELGNPQPQIVENLPTLNTDSLPILADGGMETHYRLKPALRWQDV